MSVGSEDTEFEKRRENIEGTLPFDRGALVAPLFSLMRFIF